MQTIGDNQVSVLGGKDFRQVCVRREIKAPIRRVWRAITDPAEIGHWWAEGIIEAREGGRFALGIDEENCDEGAPGLDGIVKVCIEPYLFEFTWHKDYPDAGLVRFDLLELADDKTLVTVTQNIPASDVIPATAGWYELIERLATFGETDQPVPQPEENARFEELKKVVEAAGLR